MKPLPQEVFEVLLFAWQPASDTSTVPRFLCSAGVCLVLGLLVVGLEVSRFTFQAAAEVKRLGPFRHRRRSLQAKGLKLGQPRSLQIRANFRAYMRSWSDLELRWPRLRGRREGHGATACDLGALQKLSAAVDWEEASGSPSAAWMCWRPVLMTMSFRLSR